MTSKCHDCDASEGQLHEPGCDMERCPFCGGQLITCDCCYTKLGFHHDNNEPYSGLPRWIYENGLPHELEEEWSWILNNKGRVPWIQYPNICVKCGKLWPEMFEVPNEEWDHYVEPRIRHEMLCRECYDYIKRVTDEAVGNLHP